MSDVNPIEVELQEYGLECLEGFEDDTCICTYIPYSTTTTDTYDDCIEYVGT